MDPNGHINNVAYLAWALEVIPDYICQDYQLTEVRTREVHTCFDTIHTERKGASSEAGKQISQARPKDCTPSHLRLLSPFLCFICVWG
jgi:acyl-ACP thioesterase